MQAKPKANSIITARATWDDMIDVTVSIPRRMIFTVLGVGDVENDFSKWSPRNLGRSVVHGAGQRIPDAAAIGRADKDGEIIPKDERTRIKYERMNDLCRFYESGTEEWARKAEGGSGGGRSVVVEAIARMREKDYATVSEHIDREAKRLDVSRAKLLASLRADKEIAEVIREIEDERAARGADSTIDAGEILDGLGSIEE